MSAGPPTVGFVTALQMERRWLDPEVDPRFVEVGGMGRERAEAASRLLLSRGATALVSWGVAGGLDPELESGTVVLADAVHASDDGPVMGDTSWRDRLVKLLGERVSNVTGSVVHADEILDSAAIKGQVFERTRASVVDMETLGVAGVAVEAGVSWIAVRVVTDNAGMSLPPAVTSVSDERGRLRPTGLARLVLSPWLWPDLSRLARANTAAARSMRELSRIAGADLAKVDDGRQSTITTGAGRGF